MKVIGLLYQGKEGRVAGNREWRTEKTAGRGPVPIKEKTRTSYWIS